MKINKLEIIFDDDVDVSEVNNLTKKVIKNIEDSIERHNNFRPAHLPVPRKVTGGSAFPYYLHIFKNSFPIKKITYEVTLK
jgi:cbb3-type cytochrome oxidase cytochrome c subunit